MSLKIGSVEAMGELPALAATLGSYDFLSQILEETPNGLLVVGKDDGVLYGNPTACRFLGVGKGDLVGKNVVAILGRYDIDLAARLKDDALFAHNGEGQERIRHELAIETAEGESRVVEAVFVRPDPEGGYYLVYLINVSARKNLEVELRRRNVFFQKLIDSSVDGIIAADMRGRIIIFNRGAQQMLGYEEEEAIHGVHVTRLYPEGEAYEIMKRMRSEEYGGTGKLMRHPLVGVTKQGERIPMSLSGGIIYDEGREIASFGIFTDLRVVQRIQQDLEQTHQMLIQSEKMAGLGRLSAGVAHEINNPLSGVMLFANLAKESLDAEHPAAKDLGVVIHEAERCRSIISELLEFSHQTSYEMSSVDVNGQIRKTMNLLGNQALFQNVEVILDLKEGLSPIWGNGSKLSQVFVNISINAAQAMAGAGRLAIGTRRRSEGNIVEVTFQDTGPGIDEKILPEIFDPFFTTKSTQDGTGLGLAVSYAIMKEHKGTIRADSRPNEGATFTLHFPAFRQTLEEVPT